MAFYPPYEQEGDPLLHQTLNGGDLTATDGFIQMSGGLPTAVYLSCFGGNFEDDGRQDNSATWWGNVLENSAASEYRSVTQWTLENFTPIPANLPKIEDAVRQDLQWLLDQSIASTVTITATMPALNRVQLNIVVQADGDEHNFNYVENWRAGGFEPIIEPLVPEWRVLESFYPRLTENGEPRTLEP